VKAAPERIYLRRCPSGALLSVVHEEPLEGVVHIEYVRVDLVRSVSFLPDCLECGSSLPVHYPGCGRRF